MTFVLIGIAAVALWLAVIDARTQRIPNRIVLPSILIAAVLFAAFSWAIAGQALLAATISFAVLLVLNLVSRGQLGMGDVKLAALLGLGLGAIGWGYWLLGLSLGFVFGGLGATVLLARSRGRVGLKSYFAYGPYLVAGALVAGALAYLRF
jgi:leader peptidase (prepilin peptidase)/N-methyltransferase